MKRLYVTVLLAGLLTFGMFGITMDRAAAVSITPSNEAPTAEAGPDQTVDEGIVITLDGSASSDPETSALSYFWIQIAGPDVDLDLSNTVNPTFVAPQVSSGNATLTFQLIVNDGSVDSLPDTVNIVVKNINHPPVADAGDDRSVNEDSPVTLIGSSSYDPDGDNLTFSWAQISGLTVVLSDPSSPVPSFTAPPVGQSGTILTFKLIVNDGSLFSAPDYVNILVNNENHPPIADAGENQTKDEAGEVTLDGTKSYDPDGDNLTFSWAQVSGRTVVLSDPSGPIPSFTAPLVNAGGERLVFRLTVNDGHGGVSSDDVSIEVLNINDPPNCNLAKPAMMWPPNHKMVPVAITNIADANNDGVTVTILSVTQDEPVNGLGDGDTSPDAAISGNNALIRSERAGIGDGRVYKINFRAVNILGEGCTGSVTVCVPHSMKPGTCIDSGQSFNSFEQ